MSPYVFVPFLCIFCFVLVIFNFYDTSIVCWPFFLCQISFVHGKDLLDRKYMHVVPCRDDFVQLYIV